MEFSEVHYKRMGSNPAQVDRGTGELFVNPDIWPYLPESFKTWILLHEEGHLKGGLNGQPTADELLADKYAFENYVGTEKESLRKSVLILHETLPKHTSDQWKRIIVMYARTLEYDYRYNGNTEALEELNIVREQLKDYVDVPTIPIGEGLKSNFIVTAITAVVSLFSAGLKKRDQNKQSSQAEILELHAESVQSDTLANEFIYGKTIGGVDTSLIYGLVALVVIVGIALFLKKRLSK